MLVIIAIVIGAFLGGAWGRDVDVLFGALLGWLLVRTVRQQRELASLRQAVTAPPLAAPLAPPAQAGQEAQESPAAPAAEAVQPESVGAPPEPSAPPAAVSEPQPAMAAAAALPDVSEHVPATLPVGMEPLGPPPAEPRPGVLASLRAWMFGGNTIVKAGVAILFIGLAFLAKYATEHAQLPIELRLAAVAGVAIVLLVLGWRLRTRRAGYAQVLQGGAVAVLYLTLFVAFRFYGVLAIGPVFAMMVAIAALAAALAILQEAPALAVIGALGGFATPLLVSTGSGDHVALFSYYLVLDLGIAAVAWFRTWRVLNLVGFVCTFVIGSAWGVLKYEPEHFASSQTFLILYFLLFVAVLLLPSRRSAEDGASAKWVNGSLLFGLPTVSFALQYGLVRHTEYGVALSALVLAGFYVALATAMRHRARLALTFEASLAIGTVFLTLVIPFALDARSTAGAWSLEGAGLVWLGLRQSRRLPRVFGYLLLMLAGWAMVFGHSHGNVSTGLWNATLFNALMAAAASLGAAFFVQRHAPRLATGEGLAEPVLIGWATLWLLFGIAAQVEAFVPGRLSLAVWVACLSAIAALYTLLAQRLQWPMVNRPVLAHMPLMALAMATSALLQRNPLHHGGWWAWPLALAVHALVLQVAAPQWPQAGRRIVHALGALLVAALLALLGRALTAEWGDELSAWPWLGWLVGPALLLLWLPRPGTALRWPVRAEALAYQRHAAGLLALVGLLWALLANSVSTGAARPLPHVPLVNPLDLGIATALLAAWWWWRSEAAAPLRDQQAATGPVLLGGLSFLWLNGMLLRAFHHWAEVPYRLDDWADSLAVQTGLTLLWSTIALALMWLSARRAARALWLVGAVLLGVVVLKLLLVDLSGSGTVARIVSFIGVGVLMLVIGYVAPLPASAEKRHAN
ncbi:DUF2339 domain-containing protein [Aquabacterium sp.]|uniref:DUF2339 domain-containing protein n=1 Tax=Aquabacterium sp. TaxID=1872578 RepID=UPI002BE1DC3D|nr:DUF2339 domain-containing protein [Aquabacterium sp.]HSW07827.1 DUF2339 domain-containing protein [Aquabacterium sp.]